MKANDDISTKAYYRYALDVVEGRIVTGDYIKLACKDYLQYIDSPEYELRTKVVDRAIRFIRCLEHFKGEKKPFILEPWQQWIVSALVGVYRRGTNIRKHKFAYLEISRKNGKTALAAALTLYFLIGDKQNGAEVGLVANSREQAKIAYEFCEVWARQLDPQQKELKAYRDRLTLKPTNSKLVVCSSADDKLDGHGFTTAVVDEFHAAKDNKLRDVIKSSMTRENALLLTITTAGFDMNGVCYKLRQSYIEILQGLKKDPSVFSAIYTLDTDDFWQDPDVWEKSTPNINVTVQKEYIENQVLSAINNPSEETGVRTKTLNQWVSSSTVWLPDSQVLKVFDKVNLNDFAPRSTILFGGIDLASTGDLACVSLLLVNPKDPKLYFKNYYYLPQSALETSANKELYKYWARTGQLTVTEGNVTDYSYILNDIMRIRKKFVFRSLGVDTWNASQFQIGCTEQGLPMVPISQSLSNLNRPTKELERLIKMGTDIIIDSNEVTAYCFRNAVPKYDWNENLKITKVAYENKIDGVVAIIMALCSYLDTPRFRGGVSSV